MIKVFNGNNNSFTVIINNRPYSIDKTHPNYNVLLKAFHENDENSFLENVTPMVHMEKYVANTGIEVKENEVLYNGQQLHGTVVDILIDYKRNGHDITSLVAFLENLYQNPSATSRKELYDFIANRGMPITEDGCVIAYKSVGSDFYSKTAGDIKLIQGKIKDRRVFNGVGEIIECDRGSVDDNRENECSHGLHTGAYEYAGHGGWFNDPNDKVVLIKFNPKDVVSVPKDHNARKVRVCKYEVLAECTEKLDNTVYGAKDTWAATQGFTSNEVNSVLEKYNSVDEDEEDDICSECDRDYAYCDCDANYDDAWDYNEDEAEDEWGF